MTVDITGIRFHFDDTRVSIKPESFYAVTGAVGAALLAIPVAAGAFFDSGFHVFQPLIALPILAATFAFGDAAAIILSVVAILSGLIPSIASPDAPWKLYACQSVLLCLIAWLARQIVSARQDHQFHHYNAVNHRQGEIDFLDAQITSERNIVASVTRKAGQWEQLDAAVQSITAAVYPDKVAGILEEEMRKFFPGHQIEIALKNDEHRGAITEWILRTNQSVIIDDVDNDVRFRHLAGDAPFRSFIGVPILESAAPVGVMAAFDPAPRALDMDHLRLMHKFSEIAAIIIRNADIYRKTDIMGKIDSLTGLSKRWYFQNRFDDLCRAARRDGEPIAVIMSDIDFFKRVNDRLGHPEGDRVLKEVAGVFDEAFGKCGVTGRYGGEEFIAAVPQEPADDIVARVEKYRANVERRADIGVTVSCGVSVFPVYTADLDALVGSADRALYDAKESGRNRVICAGREAPS